MSLSAAPDARPATTLIKIVITGPFGAGKTTLVQRAVASDTLDAEAMVTEAMVTDSTIKSATTVALDYGRLRLEADGDSDAVELALFGTPGQSRFSIMWEVLATGMDGYVVLLDATRPESWAEAAEHIQWFGSRYDVPWILAANRADPSDTDLSNRLREALDLSPSDSIVLYGETTISTASAVVAALVDVLLTAAGVDVNSGDQTAIDTA